MKDKKRNNIAKKIITTLKEKSAWTIICHENPDGDTLGSGLALYSLALRLNKKVSIIGRDPIPDTYLFLPYAKDYVQCDTLPDFMEDELIICVDTSNESRTVNQFSQLKNSELLTINIDHHGDNENFCSLNLIIPEASATAEIVSNLFIIGNFKMTDKEATALYVGLVTDNGNFRFSSTSSNSHECAAYLIEAGAKPSEIDDLLMQNLTIPILKLWGKAFSRAEILASGKAAIFWLEDRDFKDINENLSAVDGLVNTLLRIKGVEVAVLACEYDYSVKLSIRTRAPYSAREIASVFGGGGHVVAAGARVIAGLTEVLQKLRSLLNEKCV